MDFRVFHRLKYEVSRFEESYERGMKAEEFFDFCKVHIENIQFINHLVDFCTSEEELSKKRIEISKLEKLIEVVNMLPFIITKQSNVSTALKDSIEAKDLQTKDK